MLETFHRLPDIAALSIIVGAMVGLVMLASVAGSRLLGSHRSQERDDAAFDAYKALMATAGVVLAFSLVQVTANLRTVEETVGREASLITVLDRSLLRYGTSESASLRPLVSNLANLLIHEEWPALKRGDRSDKADQGYVNLSKAIRAMHPADRRQQAMFQELIKGLDDLSDSREALIEDASIALPRFYWIVTGGFFILSLVLASATEPRLMRLTGLGSAAAGVGLILAFVVIVDQPFQGETSVSPAPIQKAIKLNARRF